VIGVTGALLVAASLVSSAQPGPGRLSLLDVPFISQSEALCGGAAAAMVLRYWGETGVAAEDFVSLVDRQAGGIRTGDLVRALQSRGARAAGAPGTAALARRELDAGRPVIALIEDRPRAFHYVVIVGWHERAVVVHDPARTPYVVMKPAEFERRWAAGANWMLALAPGDSTRSARRDPQPLHDESPPAASACDALVSEGVRLAQGDDLTAAERILADAAYRCPGAAPLRELAGVRLLQRRWPEVTELARRAVDVDPGDAHAWQLLATSRYVAGDRRGALDAWNRAAQPMVDLVSVSGLQRTTHRTVERLVDIEPERLLTRARFERAARRLDELPAAMSTRLEYLPRAGGRVEVRANVAERRMVPSSPLTWLALAVRAAAARELAADVNGAARGGERLEGWWRFWPHRPGLGASLATPAASAGIFTLTGFTETQPFTAPGLAAAERTGARAELADWATGRVRWQARGGVDHWKDTGRFAVVGGGIRIDRGSSRIDAGVDGWLGARRFSMAHAAARWRSSDPPRAVVFVGRAGADWATSATPLDLWPAGDTGHARGALLRAHPVLDDGRLDVERLGRVFGYATGEAQRWWRGPGPFALGAALFVDAGRTARRGARVGGPDRRPITDIDIGAGLRAALPGGRGLLRIDAGHGLRDGRGAISIAWEP
jgi:predicted double-glycine peptidase